jgi:hypothetical protein
MANRRNFIRLIGGGVVIAAAAGAGLTAFPLGLADPSAAWLTPGAGETDPRRRALAFAILAPNPHNMQPWLADLREPGAVSLFVDRTRLLPATDPFSRQILIGCGAFLALLEMAARAQGATVAITPFPQGEPGPSLDDRPFARVVFSAGAPVADPLFAQVLARRTNRNPYDMARIPSAADLQAVALAGVQDGLITAAFTADPARTAALRDIVWRGWLREMNTPAALKESVDVMRIGDRAVTEHRDGIALDGPMMNLLGAAGLMSPAALLDPQSEANKAGMQMWKAMADSAPAFLWQIGVDNRRTTQLAVGAAYLRLNLEATARGLSIHPWSMALQEYPEMADLYREQQAMLGGAAQSPVHMLVRIGYATAESAPAPRRGLPDHVKDA